MSKFTLRFTNDIELEYQLVDSIIVNEWKRLIDGQTVSGCCPINHFSGYASDAHIQSKIDRLNHLADYINLQVPDRVVKQEISFDHWQKPLSIMHVHFPELHGDTSYASLWDTLTEYNDIIHWLESSMPFKNSSKFFRLTLDFNKSVGARITIPDEEFVRFTPLANFGTMSLHYTHVGKNAFELFFTKDFDCPADQFVPQREISPSVRFGFTDNFFVDQTSINMLYESWHNFYEQRGGLNFWKLDINDPKIAFGFLEIGSLVKITKECSEYTIPKTIEELNAFRTLLAKCDVIDWILST